jgi:ABC-type antimicrobial peptide transport system permease subunit
VYDTIPDLPFVRVTTARQVIATDMGQQRLGAFFFSGFGVVALALGLVSVFGLVAYVAQARRREFGIRLALGASPRQLVMRASAAALTPVVVGAAVGAFVSGVVAHTLGALLPGVRPFDEITYVTVSLVMIVPAAAAGLMAAWPLRALPPGEALRAE